MTATEIALWGPRRCGTNLLAMLLKDQGARVEPGGPGDDWKHGVPSSRYPAWRNVVIVKHPQGWIGSIYAWTVGSVQFKRELAGLIRQARNVASRLGSDFALHATLGFPLDQYLKPVDAWREILVDPIVVRLEDLLVDPEHEIGRALGRSPTDTIELPNRQVQPGQGESQELVDQDPRTRFYVEQEWADHYTWQERAFIEWLIREHGYREALDWLGYEIVGPEPVESFPW